MSKLDRVVKVIITRLTQPVGRPSFDKILIVGDNWTFSDRYKQYSTDDLAAIAADLTAGVADPEYLAAVAIASQNPRPSIIAGGRKDAGDADYTEALNAVLLESTNFYGVIGATRVQTEQEDVIDWVNANTRICISASAGTDIGAGVFDIIDETEAVDNSSLAKYLKTNALDRNACVYHADAATNYIDAGLLGLLLVQRPGTYTPMFKTVIGSAVDALTPTQQTNLFDKYCSSYEEVGEVNIIQEGWVGTGEFLDLIIWIDWLKAQVQTQIYSYLVNEPKIPITDGGIAGVEAKLDQVLKVEQDAKAISPDAFDSNNNRIGGYETSVPDAANILPADKLARVLKDVKFTAFYETPMHRIEIDGVVRI